MLLVAAVAALVAAQVLRTPTSDSRASDATAASRDVEAPSHGGPDLVAAVERITSIEQPLTVWLDIADCESGEWDADADPVPGTAEWSYGTDADRHRFEGGLHFEPTTWEAYRDTGMPDHAGAAAPVSQMVVAERVLEEQGWEAWPVCSQKVGVR